MKSTTEQNQLKLELTTAINQSLHTTSTQSEIQHYNNKIPEVDYKVTKDRIRRSVLDKVNKLLKELK